MVLTCDSTKRKELDWFGLFFFLDLVGFFVFCFLPSERRRAALLLLFVQEAGIALGGLNRESSSLLLLGGDTLGFLNWGVERERGHQD